MKDEEEAGASWTERPEGEAREAVDHKWRQHYNTTDATEGRTARGACVRGPVTGIGATALARRVRPLSRRRGFLGHGHLTKMRRPSSRLTRRQLSSLGDAVRRTADARCAWWDRPSARGASGRSEIDRPLGPSTSCACQPFGPCTIEYSTCEGEKSASGPRNSPSSPADPRFRPA